MKNKNIISQSNKVGCYHCCKTFNYSDIKNFTDNDQTALCPFCSVDCIIADSQGVNISEEFLIKAKKFWFGE